MREIKWKEVDQQVSPEHGERDSIEYAVREIPGINYVVAKKDGVTNWYILRSPSYGPPLTDDEKEAACNLARIIYETRRRRLYAGN